MTIMCEAAQRRYCIAWVAKWRSSCSCLVCPCAHMAWLQPSMYGYSPVYMVTARYRWLQPMILAPVPRVSLRGEGWGSVAAWQGMEVKGEGGGWRRSARARASGVEVLVVGARLQQCEDVRWQMQQLGRLCRRDVDNGAHVAPQLNHAALGHALHAISERHLGRGTG